MTDTIQPPFGPQNINLNTPPNEQPPAQPVATSTTESLVQPTTPAPSTPTPPIPAQPKVVVPSPTATNPTPPKPQPVIPPTPPAPSVSPMSEPPPPDTPGALPNFFAGQPSGPNPLTSNEDPPGAPKSKKGHGCLGFFLGLVFGAALLAGAGYWYFIMEDNPIPFQDETADTTDDTSPDEQPPVSTPITSDDPTDPGGTEDPVADDTPTTRYMAFAREDDIYIMDLTTQAETPITTDGTEDDIRFFEATWKDNQTLSYVGCDTATACNTVYQYSLSTEESTQLYTLDDEMNIADLSWSNDGQHLAILYTDAEGIYTSELRNGETITTLQVAENPVDGRGGSLSDAIDTVFSPSDTYVAVVNTTLYAGEDTATILLYEIDGTAVAEIGGDWASFPFFIDDETLGYILGGSLFTLAISTEEQTELTTLDGYNPALSPSGETISYWILQDDIPTLYLYDIASDSSELLLTNLSISQWLNDSSLVATKNEACDECMQSFQPTGIAIADSTDQTWSNLIVDDTISDFAINPL